jgi:hypothetical protein
VPSVNRLESDVITEVNAPVNLQDSWKAWFDHIGRGTTQPATTRVASPEPEQEVEKEPEEEPEAEVNEVEEVNIPIRAIYQAPPRELLPHYTRDEVNEAEEEPFNEIEEYSIPRRGGNRGLLRTVQVVAALLAIAFASLATIGSGYLDNFIASSSQASAISGVQVYNK